ncbi:ABC transporter permease [Fusibacter paucivorans]|uniref:ABC transporter permease n=1 Tax=Fusibacter paucivorans TaxID=76009 RepID=A0ABS5PLB9_9FIRM|nr:ABC transporter permease [Fusibacter paucivorans]MBS7525851.1 ABC transporter permease [Fusibacter paucivorans]
MKSYKIYLAIIIIAFAVYTLFGGTAHQAVSGASLESPSLTHPLGTDDLGIDILAQLIHGGGYSIFLGIFSAGSATFIGSIIGIISGYIGGKIDHFLMAVCDIITGMPQMILLILLGAFLGASYLSMIIVLAMLSWPQTARTIRARVLFIKEHDYIRYSKQMGTPLYAIITRHFLPPLKPLLTLAFIKMMSRSIMMEASLAYLGLGDPTSKSWGMMLNKAMAFPGIYFTPYWKWWLTAPLIALVCLILSLMLLSKEIEV